MSLVFADGGDLHRDQTLRCDVVVVGSGPAGATTARSLAREGANVIVLEEGPWVRPAAFPRDASGAVCELYRDMGAALTRGRASMPLLQGRVLGGTSIVNSAICWRLPREVHADWILADPALGEALPWDLLDGIFDRIEQDLGVAPAEPAVAGPRNLLMGEGAEALGLAHQPTRRNTSGCRGLGRCNLGCPIGAKLSMDRSYLPDAVANGARIVPSVRVDEIIRHRGAAVGVAGRAAGSGRLRVEARTAVVLAAGAVHTPVLLLANGVRHGPVGRRFQCHPGLAMAGFFPDPVRPWTGATQGHEVIGLRDEGIKLETLGLDLAPLATRFDGIGSDLARDIDRLAHSAAWGAAIRARAWGEVRPGRHGPNVRFDLLPTDVVRLRRAVRALGEVMLAAGATEVVPGVHGWHTRVSDAQTMARFETDGPVDPRAYQLAISHMFGTCVMGSDPATSVVRPDFRHHAVAGLYVADSSVFPTNLGVNPQVSIMALATICARSVARR